MKKINPEHIKALIDLINRGPYFQLLSMNVCEIGIGHSIVKVMLEKKHLNPFGAIHGGVYASIIDTAAFWSAYCELDENAGFTSIDLSVNNLSSINTGEIIVEGKSLKIGRSICMTEAAARDTHGKLLACGTSKLMILDGKQSSIIHSVEAMGKNILPPKFID